MESPCRTCELHHQGISKSSQECRVCPDRILYVRNMAARDHNIPTVPANKKAVSPEKKDHAMDEMKQKKCSECKKPFPPTPEFFNRHAFTADGLMGICKTCQGMKISASHKRGKKKAAAKKIADQPKTTNSNVKPTNCHKLTIDFSKHPQHFKKLCEIADDELRSVENQALFFLIRGFETINSITEGDNFHEGQYDSTTRH